MRKLVSMLAIVGAAACAGNSATELSSSASPTRAPYDPAQLLEVELTIADEDFALLRGEGRDIWKVFGGCFEPSFDYTRVPARARFAGEEFARVGVRKRGFVGSLAWDKPSLHIDVDAYDGAAAFRGAHTLILTNSRQDPSFMHQCLAYAIFEKAGLPASRCSFAHVKVNDEDLGIYVNVEPIKRPMLGRYFPETGGNLYEGVDGADFVDVELSKFDKKTHEADPSRRELTALSGALLQTDEAMVDAVQPLVDLEEFTRFWAVETLTAHWDGYTGDMNNFYVYANPRGGKLAFIPWGTDGAFQAFHPFLPSGVRPAATLAWGRLATRLYAYPQTRETYRATLEDVLKRAWDEEALLDQIDAWAALLGKAVDDYALDDLRNFIVGRRALIRAELDAPAVEWEIPQREPMICQDP